MGLAIHTQVRVLAALQCGYISKATSNFEMESKSDAADALAGVWRAGHEYTGEAVLEDDGVTKLVHVKRLRRYPCCPLQRKISDTEVQVGTNVRAKQ